MASGALAQQATTDQQSAAYEISVSQDGLKRDAASVRAELVRIRDEMRQLMPDDVAVIDRAIQQMDSLSHDEMERVIQILRGASKPDGSLSARAQALAAALRDQGTISTSLKRLAIGLDARQSMEGLATEISALLMRQVATRDELVRLSVRDKTPDKLRNRERERYDVVNEDQKSLTDDIKLLLQRLDHVAQTLTGDAQQTFTRAVAVARAGKLNELADSAASLTAQGPFDQATASQGQMAALLVNMEQALASAERPADRLAALEDKLKKTLDEQKDITQTIAGFHERQSVEHETKRAQDTVSDQIAELRAEMQPLNAQAATDLQAAQDAAEQASKHYDRMWEERPEAQQSTRDAMAQLTAALQAVDKQAAALVANTPATSAQLDAALGTLARDAAQAADVAKNIAVATPSPTNTEQQKALAATVADLQQRALPVSPEAAQALSEAAADLQQAGNKPAQQAAAQQLAQAAQELAQQQAALEGRTLQQQALAQAETQAAKAAQDLAQAQANMASDKTSAQAVNQMNAVQQEAAAAQRAAQQAGAPADAQQALADAARDMAQAQNAAAGVQLPQAQAAAKAAQAALAKAGQGMEAARQAPMQQAMAAMPSKAGNDPGQRQQDGGTPQGQGNGGGGKSGDFLAGAGATMGTMEPVSGLNAPDRAAITQLQAEKPPAEFTTDVQQYYKNLADGAGL